MLTISNKQSEYLRQVGLQKFILMQVANLKSKQPGKVASKSDKELYNITKNIVMFGETFGIIIGEDIEYLINVCFKYAVFYDQLEGNDKIMGIFTYPDRKAKDKILHLHHLLEYR
jgi:hypothetical protein